MPRQYVDNKSQSQQECPSNLVCPFCRSPLLSKGDAYFCVNCKQEYPHYKFRDIGVIDFLQITSSGKCECERDGRTICQLDLKNELSKMEMRFGKKTDTIPKYAIEKLIRAAAGKGNKILDVGCGEGPYTGYVSEENCVVGLDSCPQRMLLGSCKGTALDKGYKLLVLGDARCLPFLDHEFDIILCTELIEHILKTRDFILECRRVLRLGGKLILSTPNLVCVANRLSILLGKGTAISPFGLFGEHLGVTYPQQSLHVRFFTFESLRDFLISLGFSIEQEFGAGLVPSRIDPFLSRIFKNLCNTIVVVADKTSQ